MATEKPGTRVIAEFWQGGNMIRSASSYSVLPNVVVGQDMYFSNDKFPDSNLHGTVTKISHHMFPGEKVPVTYIDVEVVDEKPDTAKKQ